FDEKGFVTVTAQQLRQFVATDARQHRRIGDLETVEMKDGKNRTIARGVEEFVGVPTGSQRASFRFAVTDDASDNQIRFVEGRAIGMDQRIAEFSAGVNGTRRLRRDMAGNAVRPGKLAEKPMQSIAAALDRRVT